MIIKKHCLIIGAMKSGTTSLYCTIKESQNIDSSMYKDTKFFIDKNCGGNWQKGISWYQQQFSDNGIINLEASTHYSKLPDYTCVANRILKTLKDVKFIYLFRNPIDRAISHFFHNRIVDKESIDINSAFSNVNSKYYHYSNYSKQITPYSNR
ncbi:MAG: sulfotransferase domain-containing protein [Bacteroidales bacterium]|nr:sulfotransferase domain-containing protein [Bacteroidales bacterium]